MRQLLLDLFGAVAGSAPDSQQNQPFSPAQQASAAPDLIVDEAPLPLPQALAPARFSHPQANRHIVLGAARVDYLFRRGRRRTIGLAIGPDGLQVSAPRWTTVAEVEAALHEKSRWVLAKLSASRQRQAEQAAARIDWRDGAALPYLGRALTLRLDPRQQHGRAGAVLDAAEQAGKGTLWLGLPAAASAVQLRDATQAWLLGQARRLFTARLDHFAPRLQVRWQRLTLSSAGTRWGSASADGSIRLNWRLIHLDAALIDYVVVHELAHLHEMNHSPRFWQHVGRVLPDCHERRVALKRSVVPTA